MKSERPVGETGMTKKGGYTTLGEASSRGNGL